MPSYSTAALQHVMQLALKSPDFSVRTEMLVSAICLATAVIGVASVNSYYPRWWATLTFGVLIVIGCRLGVRLWAFKNSIRFMDSSQVKTVQTREWATKSFLSRFFLILPIMICTVLLVAAAVTSEPVWRLENISIGEIFVGLMVTVVMATPGSRK